MAKQARTLLEICVARSAAVNGGGGMLDELLAAPRGLRVAQFVVEWAIALRAGVEPETRAVAAWWKEPERTAYRRNAEFKLLFPDEPNPARMAGALADGLGDERPRRGDVTALLSRTLPA
jgi:hypothetical protein